MFFFFGWFLGVVFFFFFFLVGSFFPPSPMLERHFPSFFLVPPNISIIIRVRYSFFVLLRVSFFPLLKSVSNFGVPNPSFFTSMFHRTTR